MAIIDEEYAIAQGLHKIKSDEALVASGADLDRIGRGYSLGRTLYESDDHYRHRIWLRIMKVIHDAAAAEIERRRTEFKEANYVWGAESAAERKRFWDSWAATG